MEEYGNGTHLFSRCLIRSVTELRRCIYPFEIDLLKRFAACVREHGFAESHDSLLYAGDGAFEEDEVVLDFAVADEAAHAGSH